MTKRETNSLIKKINSSKEKLSAERDKLRDLILELESLADDCDEALEALNNAANALSQQL